MAATCSGAPARAVAGRPALTRMRAQMEGDLRRDRCFALKTAVDRADGRSSGAHPWARLSVDRRLSPPYNEDDPCGRGPPPLFCIHLAAR